MQNLNPWNAIQRKLRQNRDAADKKRGFTKRANTGPRSKSYRQQWEESGKPEGDFTAWLRKEGLI